MRVRLAIGLGLLLVVASLVFVLSRSEQRRAGTNAQISVSGNDVRVTAGKRLCQPELVPADTAALRVFTGTRLGAAGPVDVSIRSDGQTIARGSFDVVLDGLPATAELSDPVHEDLVGARVCLRNRGRGTVRFAGDRTPLRFSPGNPSGVLLPDEPRVDYLRAGDESWWAVAGTVADRFGRSKTSFTGTWTLWAVLGLFAAGCAAGLILLLRTVRTP